MRKSTFARVRFRHRAFFYRVSTFLVKYERAHCIFSLLGLLFDFSIQLAAPVS